MTNLHQAVKFRTCIKSAVFLAVWRETVGGEGEGMSR